MSTCIWDGACSGVSVRRKTGQSSPEESTAVEGAFYLPRNSNNPVSAKAAWTISIAAGALDPHLRTAASLSSLSCRNACHRNLFFSPHIRRTILRDISRKPQRAQGPGSMNRQLFRLNNLPDSRFPAWEHHYPSRIPLWHPHRQKPRT